LAFCCDLTIKLLTPGEGHFPPEKVQNTVTVSLSFSLSLFNLKIVSAKILHFGFSLLNYSGTCFCFRKQGCFAVPSMGRGSKIRGLLKMCPSTYSLKILSARSSSWRKCKCPVYLSYLLIIFCSYLFYNLILV
jgi:hypothetical protein